MVQDFLIRGLRAWKHGVWLFLVRAPFLVKREEVRTMLRFAALGFSAVDHVTNPPKADCSQQHSVTQP